MATLDIGAVQSDGATDIGAVQAAEEEEEGIVILRRRIEEE